MNRIVVLQVESRDIEFKVSTKEIALSTLSNKVLAELYGPHPCRYNSIIDLACQRDEVRSLFLSRFSNQSLWYRVYFVECSGVSLPLLECIRSGGDYGAMLSTFLHDLDRSVIEGRDPFQLSVASRTLWRLLLKLDSFSFHLPQCPNSSPAESITYRYLLEAGFICGESSGMRCFFNTKISLNEVLLQISRELMLALKGSHPNWKYDSNRFEEAKETQFSQITAFVRHIGKAHGLKWL